jgi:UDP-N-acetylglucosamine:LPS N-acetylglucosamine transferase
MRNGVKLCVGASSGGHMSELAAVLALQDRWPVRPDFYVSTLTISNDSLPAGARAYVIGECDRHKPIDALKTLLRSIRIAYAERPSVILTTGSMPLALFSLACKLFGAKIIWIDSISQMETLSMSGKLIRPFADLFFVQWPELVQRYRNVRYEGELV